MPPNISAMLIYLLPLMAIMGLYIFSQQRRHKRSLELLREATETGLLEPASLHPLINESLCIGCKSCINACPEHDVLGLINNIATLVGPSNCIGHGACREACPVNAIDLVFGTATRGVDIPLLQADFQTSVPGIYIAGELGGMGLVRNAITQGVQAVDCAAKNLRKCPNDPLDLVIVGAGPAGLAASLAAKELGLSYVTLDHESGLGGTIAHFPRGKLVMTRPATLPLVGKFQFVETSKEHLLAFWQDVVDKHPLNLRFSEGVTAIDGDITNDFTTTTTLGQFRSQRVLLCIGRRGTPRKLNIPGEDLNKVAYRLQDATQYAGMNVMIMGGGDSALEAAISLAEQENTQVSLCYRGKAFNRAKFKNRERIQILSQEDKLTLHMESEPTAIERETVTLTTPDGTKVLPNQAVIICAGGVLPTAFLQNIGIQVDTKYGSR
ncbi:NAD(P)-binding domain-containing protein [Zhongshania sp. BJYM1]|uniref:NAD(P)-binding domain-containing protein n=1 Tax=Zhongshania aquatica TaxID=2965069 RepID=UPI0022B35E91|nr:NAD(P)-binding domain-containing protein [Marortus sp. BJYM1]